MSDFSRPEYASYLQLCRELRLEREPLRGGDWFYGHDRTNSVAGTWRCDVESLYMEHDSYDAKVWLPSLADWLERLEGRGFTYVRVERIGRRYVVAGALANEEPPWDHDRSAGVWPSREEAAARLWIAVSRPVPV